MVTEYDNTYENEHYRKTANYFQKEQEDKAYEKRRFAHKMRCRQTPAEKLFFKRIGRTRLYTQCQHIIAPYIVDFLIEGKIVVEIDGGYHFTPEQIEYDKRRDEYLAAKGYAIVRIKNEEVPIVNMDYLKMLLGKFIRIEKKIVGEGIKYKKIYAAKDTPLVIHQKV